MDAYFNGSIINALNGGKVLLVKNSNFKNITSNQGFGGSIYA
jgi:hypothetical protein